ncbi:SCO family protein [Neisseriaceae bacterium JH1-16]|nr:SCO family protein [Neisseriaceae bacterium JH1-16]
MRRTDRRTALRYLTLPFAAGLLAACGKQAVDFNGTDISTSSLTMNVALTDHTGRRRTLADFRGKVVALYLGYTHCPDVCPATMGELKLAKQVQVLFVTVDPERDTQQVLDHFVSAFDPRFLGLRGPPDELKALAGQLKVFYERTGQANGDYAMMHYDGVFLFDRQGHIRVIERSGIGSAALAADMRQLVEGA